MKQEEEKKNVNMECEYDEFENTIIKMKEIGAKFLTVSTLRSEEDDFWLIYYFQHLDRKIVLRVKTKDNSIPSLYSYFGIADFLEREINNLFEIKFVGHPNLARIPKK